MPTQAAIDEIVQVATILKTEHKRIRTTCSECDMRHSCETHAPTLDAIHDALAHLGKALFYVRGN